MIGTPVTHFGKFSEGSVGFIIIADTDDLYLEDVTSVIFQDAGASSETISEATDLATLSGYVSDDEAITPAWYKSSSLLYLYFPTATLPYEADTLFTVLGTRTGIPIKSLEDESLDVPEKHLELFLKYAIREAAQMLGKQVPPSITKDITELESNI